MIGPDIIKDTKAKVQVIRQRLKAASDRKKSYADLKMKDIEYEVGDKVFLKVSPWRKVLRFGKKRKLSSSGVSVGTPSGVSQVASCVPCVYALEIPF